MHSLLKRFEIPTFLRIIMIIFFLIWTLFPITWIVLTSLKPSNEIISFPVKYLPSRLTFENYISLFTETKFPTFFLNSTVVSLVSALIVLVVAVFAGYGLARYEFKGKITFLLFILFTQMIPYMVILVPLFIIFSKLNLINNLMGLIIVYAVINIPFCVLLMRGFFERIPNSLEESAMVDGCSRIRALFVIILPIMIPGVISTFVFAFIGAWNELFFSIMFINSDIFKTLPVGMTSFILKYEVNWGAMTAATVLSLIPVTLLFIFVQKYIVQGLTQGAVKG